MAGAEELLDGADEADFLELLLANERMMEWADQLQTPGNRAGKKLIVLEMHKMVESRTAYAEEAQRAGIIPIITRMLCNTEDEELMSAISGILVACSGPMACGGKVKEYTYGNITLHIKEGALGDGLGARVWTVAHILCREMIAHPEFISGKDVLEIGAGCGVCGVLAAKLNAKQAVLTDVEGPVLRNLRDCMHLNQEPFEHGDDAASKQKWESGVMSVRKLDWLESLRIMDMRRASQDSTYSSGLTSPQNSLKSPKLRSSMSPNTFYKNDLLRSAADLANKGDEPGNVPVHETFERIIGTDIMYEPMHARLVAAVLAHRLAPGGAALLCCAVRQARTFAAFTAECAKRGLRYRKRQVQPAQEYGGILGRDEDYEGGFLLMAVDHVSSECTEWHRSDWDEQDAE